MKNIVVSVEGESEENKIAKNKYLCEHTGKILDDFVDEMITRC